MSELVQLQDLFSGLVARLIEHIRSTGHFVSLGEAYRTPEQAALNAQRGIGIANSLHIDRLAIDLIVRTSNGVVLTQSEDHKPFGEWWEQQNPLCRWGGRFTRPDGGHYSITYQGRR